MNQLHELDMKSANAEGTEMDAFNSTLIPTTTTPIQNCIVEAQPKIQLVPTPLPLQPQPTVTTQSILSPVQLPPQMVATPNHNLPEVKCAKIDITNIVKETPRSLNVQIPPATQKQIQSVTIPADDTDTATCDTLLVQDNIENNIQAISPENSDTQVIDETIIGYKKVSTEDKIRYDRNFLLPLNPKCKENPDLEIVSEYSTRLRETEIKSTTMTKDEIKTEDLYKKFRDVLNELTPQNFKKSMIQVQNLSIDNEERLLGVIELVFERDVNEPDSSVIYALMCKELAVD